MFVTLHISSLALLLLGCFAWGIVLGGPKHG